MTNAQIIFNESIRLMEEGKIGTTGKVITVTYINGEGQEEKQQINEPEAIHTFAIWKQNGYAVKKGQKAVAAINIWKYVPKTGTMEAKTDAGETVTVETDESQMFRKTAFFFSASQVEKVAK